MKVAVIGTGYVGLVAGVCFAKIAHTVTCLDNDATKIQKLLNGVNPIHEPGLDDLLNEVIQSRKISFSTDLSKVANSEVVIIAVGTPSKDDGSADLNYLKDVVKIIADKCPKGKIIVIKSTVPVGTAEMVKDMFAKIRPGVNYDIISNPEFLREGLAVEDFLKPDRVVIGCASSEAKDVAEKLYLPLSKKGVHVHYVNNSTAELIKYSANSYLAMRIAFINEMADIAEISGANIEEIAKGMGLDKRIGTHYLKSGPGYGGSCFPKDTKALAKYAKDQKVNSIIVESVIRSNDLRKKRIAEKVLSKLRVVKGKKVAVLGLAFKSDTDDLRDSPSIDIVKTLINNNVIVQAFDPSKPYEEFEKIVEGVKFFDNAIEATKGSDMVVIATEWKEFSEIDLEAVKEKMSGNIIYDLRNMISPQRAKKSGFVYISIGRPNA